MRTTAREQLYVTFDVETDVNIDQVNVQNRIAQAQPNLPADVIQYGITTRKSTGLPMLVISLYSPNRTYDSLFLANYANININDVLYRVPGVGEVQAVRRQRLRDAHLGQAGCSRQARSCRSRPGQRGEAAEHRQSFGPGGRCSLRRQDWKRPTRSARRDGFKRRRNSARSSSAPSRTARSCG